MPDLLVMEPFGKIPRWVAMAPKPCYLGFFRSEFDVTWFFLGEPGRIRLVSSENDWEATHELKPTMEQLDLFESWDLHWPQERPMNRDERLWVNSCLSSAVPVLRLPALAPVQAQARKS